MTIVLDTNIYRNLIRGKKDNEISRLETKIIESAKLNSIVFNFPIVPAMELISHYNDSCPAERNECRKALNLLVNLHLETSPTGNFTPPLDVIIGFYFFEEEGDFLEMYGQIIELSLKLTGKIKTENEDNLSQMVEIVRQQLDFEKENIRNNYEKYLESINEGSADWAYFKPQDKKKERQGFFESLRIGELSFLVAQSFIDRAYFHARKNYEKNEKFYKTARKFMKDFCPALVMNEVLLKKIGSGVSTISNAKDKRWNTVLDISLIFGVLYNPQNEPRKLVTEDKDIIDSFMCCDNADKVMNLSSFVALLNIEI